MSVLKFKPPMEQHPDAAYICTVYLVKEMMDFGCDDLRIAGKHVGLYKFIRDEYGVIRGERLIATFPITTPHVMFSRETFTMTDQESAMREYMERMKVARQMYQEASQPPPEDPLGGEKWEIPDNPKDLF